MEVKLDETTIVDVVIGSHVYDEKTDTWINGDMLDPITQKHIKTLVSEIEIATTAIRAATVDKVTTPH